MFYLQSLFWPATRICTQATGDFVYARQFEHSSLLCCIMKRENVVIEKRVASETIYSGKLINVRLDSVRLTTGRLTDREVVEHPGAVAILPVTSEGDIVLVRQYRYAVQRTLLELPAGTRESGESAEDCAIRELKEETGYAADQIEMVANILVSPGWCNEEIQIFQATRLSFVGPDPDQDEVLDVVEVRPDEIPGLIRDGEISDAKSVVALQSYLLNQRED